MQEPLVSIIIPTFNRAHLISETLDSVLAQTYQNWECIVVDDGSTDGTNKVMDEYVLKDSRFQYYHRPKDRLQGGNAARNFGFEISKGEYVNWLDSDDLFLPNKLEIQINYFQTHDIKLHVVQGQFFQKKGQNEIVLNKLWPEKFPKSNSPLADSLIMESLRWPTGAALWSRQIAGLNQWSENLEAAQEWAFHLIQSLSLKIGEFAFQEEVLIHIRKTPTSITQNEDKSERYEAYLKARITVLQYLLLNGYKMDHKYFKSIFRFSLRYVKYLVSINSWEGVHSLANLLKTSSNKKYRQFKFGILIYKIIKKEYFLKRIF